MRYTFLMINYICKNINIIVYLILIMIDNEERFPFLTKSKLKNPIMPRGK